MSYFKYYCPNCGKYYGDAISSDEIPQNKMCTDCKKTEEDNMIKSGS